MSQRKCPPEKISASALTKTTEDGDSTSNFFPLVVNPVPYINVTPHGATNDVRPMTERRAVDKSSIGNTTISALTMIENAIHLERLAQADEESVGDDGSSDAEGEGHTLNEGITITQTLRRTFWTQSLPS